MRLIEITIMSAAALHCLVHFGEDVRKFLRWIWKRFHLSMKAIAKSPSLLSRLLASCERWLVRFLALIAGCVIVAHPIMIVLDTWPRAADHVGVLIGG